MAKLEIQGLCKGWDFPVIDRLDLTVEEGCEAARLTGINILTRIKGLVGDLDRVERIVKLLAMVNCPPDFGDHPAVANGCSDLMVEVFGEKGRHARSAVGMASLPHGMPVEIEVIAEIRPPIDAEF